VAVPVEPTGADAATAVGRRPPWPLVVVAWMSVPLVPVIAPLVGIFMLLRYRGSRVGLWITAVSVAILVFAGVFWLLD